MQYPSRRATYLHRGTIPFWGVHLAAVVGLSLLGFSIGGLILAVSLYFARMFFVTAGYHRYFSHRTFKTSRPVQFVLAALSQTSMQRGALWWASHHREHHAFSDTDRDLHSAKLRGFWWSHLGWFLAPTFNQTATERIGDLNRFPELRWLDRHPHVPGVVLAVILFAVGGVHALVWGGFVSTVLLWHGTFTINSLSHMFGRRRFPTTDESRNNWLLALLTMGEGWHNNHHHYQSSTNQGFYWWEIDVTYLLLRGLAKTRLIWDLRRPPQRVLDAGRAPATDAQSAAAPAKLPVTSLSR